MRNRDWTKVLGWPGYRVFQSEIDERAKQLTLWVRRKSGNRRLVPLGVVEAVNGNIKALMRRGRGYTNLRYLLLKAQRMAATKTEFVVFAKAA